MSYSAALAFTPDPDWFLPTGDYATVQDLAGVYAADWPAARIQEAPFLPAALADTRRRVPCDWTLLSADSLGWLRLALQYATAGLVVAAANPGLSADFKIGAFSLKTDDTQLLASQADLLGYAAACYANVVLPVGVVPALFADPFPRRTIGKASVCGKPSLFGGSRGRLY